MSKFNDVKVEGALKIFRAFLSKLDNDQSVDGKRRLYGLSIPLDDFKARSGKVTPGAKTFLENILTTIEQCSNASQLKLTINLQKALDKNDEKIDEGFITAAVVEREDSRQFKPKGSNIKEKADRFKNKFKKPQVEEDEDDEIGF